MTTARSVKIAPKGMGLNDFVAMKEGYFAAEGLDVELAFQDRKSTRLNSSHLGISYAVFCLKKKKTLRNAVNSITADHLFGTIIAECLISEGFPSGMHLGHSRFVRHVQVMRHILRTQSAAQT